MTAEERFSKRGAPKIEVGIIASFTRIPVREEPIEITFVNDNGSNRKCLRVFMDAREARQLGNDLLRNANSCDMEEKKRKEEQN